MKLFIDLDGVLVDFLKAAAELGGWDDYKTEPSAEWWGRVDSLGSGWWEKLPGTEGYFKLIDAIRDLTVDVYFLTSAPKIGYLNSHVGKMEWVARNFGYHFSSRVIVVRGHAEKASFSEFGSVLIDDYGRNVEQWNEAGGVAYQHHDIDETVEYLATVEWASQAQDVSREQIENAAVTNGA